MWRKRARERENYDNGMSAPFLSVRHKINNTLNDFTKGKFCTYIFTWESWNTLMKVYFSTIPYQTDFKRFTRLDGGETNPRHRHFSAQNRARSQRNMVCVCVHARGETYRRLKTPSFSSLRTFRSPGTLARRGARRRGKGRRGKAPKAGPWRYSWRRIGQDIEPPSNEKISESWADSRRSDRVRLPRNFISRPTKGNKLYLSIYIYIYKHSFSLFLYKK